MGYDVKPEEHIYTCDCCEATYQNHEKLALGRPHAWHRVTIEWTNTGEGLNGRNHKGERLLFCSQCAEGLVDSLKAAMVTKKITEAA